MMRDLNTDPRYNSIYDPWHATAAEVAEWMGYGRGLKLSQSDRLAIARCVGLYGEPARGMAPAVANGPLHRLWVLWQGYDGEYYPFKEQCGE